jgi:hypothetical protein
MMSFSSPIRIEMSARYVDDLRELICVFDYRNATSDERQQFLDEMIKGLENARRLIEANESLGGSQRR